MFLSGVAIRMLSLFFFFTKAATLQRLVATHQPPSVIHQPPSVTHQPLSITHQPPSVTRQPPSVTHQLPLVTHKPPSVTHQPPSVTHQPPSVTQQPPSVTYKPPSVTHQPPSVTHQPPSVTHQPPSVTHQPPSVTHQPPSYGVFDTPSFFFIIMATRGFHGGHSTGYKLGNHPENIEPCAHRARTVRAPCDNAPYGRSSVHSDLAPCRDFRQGTTAPARHKVDTGFCTICAHIYVENLNAHRFMLNP